MELTPDITVAKRRLSDIQHPIKEEMHIFEQRFRDAMKSNVALLNRITYYIAHRKGKQIRPMFVLLCAKMYAPVVTESTYIGASLVEILHTATLVHDDVVDQSDRRRNFFSINALWKNKAAVLVGDFLLSKGLLLALDAEEFYQLQLLSRAIKSMSEGELLQMAKSRTLDIEEAVYYDIIRQKTASLLGASCAVGAASVDAPEGEIEKMYQLGETIGMAFQIKDDLFDYGSRNVGKPLGIDIKEKKMTLPLIHALEEGSPGERKYIIKLIRKKAHKAKAVREVIAYVKEKRGIEYAEQKMNEFKQTALNLLQDLPSSAAHDAIAGLIAYVTNRKK